MAQVQYFLNLNGLTIYDRLIKNLINNADKILDEKIDAVLSDLSKEDDRLEKMIPKSSEVKNHCLYMY